MKDYGSAARTAADPDSGPAVDEVRRDTWSRFARPDRLARVALVVVAGLLAWHTWARWGDLQIDCGREVYVPIAILHGKVLYRDLWYPYGPFAPYLQALLFLIFGVHLNVLYAFGVMLAAAGALLLFAISLRLMPALAAFIVSFAFLMKGFGPYLFNFCFPYSYAGVLGMVLGFACVYFLVRDTLDEPGRNLLWAGLAAGLALATKPEFGTAAYAAIAAAMVWRLIGTHKFSVAASQALALLPGLILAAAVYGWFMWRLSPSFILKENFQFAPGTFFMQTYGPSFMAMVGFRFNPTEIMLLLDGAAFSLAVWFLIAQALRWATRRLLNVVCLGAGMILAGALVHHYSVPLTLTELSGLIAFPRGIFAFAIVALAGAMAGFPRDLGPAGRSALMAVAVYALAVGVRVYAQDVLVGYSIYYDSLVFALFIFLISRVTAAVSSSSGVWRWSIPSALLVLEGVALFSLSYPGKMPPVLLQTPIGNIYTGAIEVHQMPRIIAFMQQESAAGRHVLVLPEAPMLYAFAGTESPTRWYSVIPGTLNPDEEHEFINQAESHGVDYVLLSNREFPEYGATHFGRSYCKVVYGWILNNYKLVGQFGRFRPGGHFAMQVYEKRGQNPSNKEQSMFDRLDGYSLRMAAQYEALRSAGNSSQSGRATDQ